MKLIYEAANSIEAHLIHNLLEQAHLTARIDGEYLQGGVGDLQAIGIVRVMVAEDDYNAAKEIIDHWDASRPEPELNKETPDGSGAKYAAVYGFTGFILGILITLFIISIS